MNSCGGNNDLKTRLTCLAFSVRVVRLVRGPDHRAKDLQQWRSSPSTTRTAGCCTTTATPDAQQLTLARANNDVQIRVFVHKGQIAADKLADAKKAFIDPYIAATVKQFVAMGAKPEQSPDSSEIAGAKAEGVKITANLGEPGAAKIYWALVGQRAVILTIFGPDREIKQFTADWDTLRSSLKVEDKSTPKPSPTP